jgi:hypothetical protein
MKLAPGSLTYRLGSRAPIARPGPIKYLIQLVQAVDELKLGITEFHGQMGEPGGHKSDAK